MRSAERSPIAAPPALSARPDARPGRGGGRNPSPRDTAPGYGLSTTSGTGQAAGALSACNRTRRLSSIGCRPPPHRAAARAARPPTVARKPRRMSSAVPSAGQRLGERVDAHQPIFLRVDQLAGAARSVQARRPSRSAATAGDVRRVAPGRPRARRSSSSGAASNRLQVPKRQHAIQPALRAGVCRRDRDGRQFGERRPQRGGQIVQPHERRRDARLMLRLEARAAVVRGHDETDDTRRVMASTSARIDASATVSSASP